MKRRLWPWFVIGFLIAFTILAMTLTLYTMLPSGQGVTRTKLWRFYLAEWPRALSAQPLGPANSNQDSLLSVTFQHVALSTVGGIVALASGWALRRRSLKTIVGS